MYLLGNIFQADILVNIPLHDGDNLIDQPAFCDLIPLLSAGAIHTLSVDKRIRDKLQEKGQNFLMVQRFGQVAIHLKIDCVFDHFKSL